MSQEEKKHKVVILGAGNVATHFALELQRVGLKILQIYSRSEKSASSLAQKLNISYTALPYEIDSTADIYLFAVNDSAIQELLEKRDWRNKLLVHTAGSVPINILSPFSANYGVFYPLQTFTKDRKIQMKEVPICIEASNKENQRLLFSIARKISDNVQEVSSEQRLILHIAAVFACNFVNHQYAIASTLLKDFNLPFDILKPLILETANRITSQDPLKTQTGPALRNNHRIMKQHRDWLTDYPEFRKIYTLVSESIYKMYA